MGNGQAATSNNRSGGIGDLTAGRTAGALTVSASISITKTSIRVASIGQPPATTGAVGALTVSASISITKTSIG